ncbi:MAG: DUF1365 domain-containing protein [Bdellovibrionaceae bacterium]|nr:DUF1365 domain-containing protein [Pseudobdellovibrionaceae bacterium]
MESLSFEIEIAEGWVSHARKNKNDLNFKYNIFNLIIPVDDINKDVLRFNKIPYMKIKSKDYLDGQSIPFKNAIHDFLNDKLNYTCEKVLLQTMPRMFGYGFNPISFWYCYKNNELDAVLSEVNNTFGERHFYFVLLEKKDDFHTLKKSFHVSPFFKVEGYYDFKFDISEKKNVVTINYFKEEKSLLLSTKIHLEKKKLKNTSALKLIYKYKWMTFMVVARIHYLAIKLWIKKIPFIKKPEPPAKDVTHESQNKFKN